MDSLGLEAGVNPSWVFHQQSQGRCSSLNERSTSLLGREAAYTPEEGDLGRQITRQITKIINSTPDENVYREQSPRGVEHTPIVYFLINSSLTRGLLLQLIGVLLLLLSSLFQADLFAYQTVLFPAQTLSIHLNVAAYFLIFCGGIQIAVFQFFLADNSK